MSSDLTSRVRSVEVVCGNVAWGAGAGLVSDARSRPRSSTHRRTNNKSYSRPTIIARSIPCNVMVQGVGHVIVRCDNRYFSIAGNNCTYKLPCSACDGDEPISNPRSSVSFASTFRDKAVLEEYRRGREIYVGMQRLTTLSLFDIGSFKSCVLFCPLSGVHQGRVRALRMTTSPL